MKTFVFPGQGSQIKGMGGSLFDEFEELTKKADEILGYSIKDLCLNDPKRELNQTQFTQPALYIVNALSYIKKIQTHPKPDFVAGHSLGEFNALLAAECFDFEAGLKLVKKRGELMSQAANGGMAAILNATKEEVETILKNNGLSTIDIANYNSPYQVVISGPMDDIGLAQSFFQTGEMLYYPLNTSGAFHSRYMHGSKLKFETYLKKFKTSEPKIPVIANVTARPYASDEIQTTLPMQIESMVRWSESVQYLMELDPDMEFEEIGQGDVLTKLIKKIKEQTPSRDTVIPKNNNPAVTAAVAGKSDDASKQNNNISAQPEAAKSGLVDRQRSLSPTIANAEEKVAAWNKSYPVGTKVKSSIMNYDNLETRTQAMVLFGHRAAVYMKGYNGYFDLDEVRPL